jgi:uncharacterized protein (DUF3820 family)
MRDEQNDAKVQAFLEKEFWPKINAEKPEKFVCFLRDDLYFIIDQRGDGSSPNIDDADIRLKEWLVSGDTKVCWSRVYSNGVTHHEFYVMHYGAAGSECKVGSFEKLVDDLGDVVLYFGKHKGKKLSEVPKDYLKWMAENTENKINRKIKAYLAMNSL